MSSVALYGFLIPILALALQLTLTIVIGTLAATGYHLYQAWVRQRERIDRQQQQVDEQQGHIHWLFVQHRILTDRMGHLEQRLLVIIHHDRVIIPCRHRIAQLAYERWPQPVQQQQQPPFAGLDGQDERESSSDDESALDTHIVGNSAAQSSWEIAEATDPQSYVISPRPPTNPDDDQISNCTSGLVTDQYGHSLRASTFLDEAERIHSYFRGGNQERPDDYFGHWYHYDSDDPEPHLPHPQHGHIVVTTTTTTQSAPIATVVGPIPSTSVTAVAATQNVTRNPRITLHSLAEIQIAEAISQARNVVVTQDDNDILPENRVNIPASRYQRAQIRQLSRNLENMHMRRNVRRVEREQAQVSAGICSSPTPSLWTPSPSSLGDIEDSESPAGPIVACQSRTQARSIDNGDDASTNAGARRSRALSEKEAAFLHGTPEQWPESSQKVGGTDDSDKEPGRDFSVRPHHREYAQHQVDEFFRLYPRLARTNQGSNIRGGSDEDRFLTPTEEEEMTVEEAQLFDKLQQWRPTGTEQSEEVHKDPSNHDRNADLDDHEIPRHHRNHMRMEADIRRHSEAQHAATSETLHSPERQYAGLGYQQRLAAEDEQKEEENHYSVHHSRVPPEDQRQHELHYNEHQWRLAHLQHQHALEARQGHIHTRSHVRPRPIHHIPPPLQESVQREQGLYHRPWQQRDNSLATLRMIRQAQSLEECDSISSHLAALRSELNQRHAQIVASQRFIFGAAMPIVYVNKGGRYAQPARRMALITPQRRLLRNARNAARANRNFDIDDEDAYHRYARYPSEYNGSEEQDSSHHPGQETADERDMMGDLTSHRSGSVPPHIRGGACNAEDTENDSIYQSADYDPVEISQAIVNLNKKLARAQEWPASDPTRDERIANLVHTITWLKGQRDYAEGSRSFSTPQDWGIREGAGHGDETAYESDDEIAGFEQHIIDDEDGWIRNPDQRPASREPLNRDSESGVILDLFAKLEDEIAALQIQRGAHDRSDVLCQMYGRDHDIYGTRLVFARDGAGDNSDHDDDDYHQFRVRHPANSNNDQDRELFEVPELEREIRRLNLLMAKAQKLPEGDHSNQDIVAQLQRMIDQLEAERDEARNSNVTPAVDEAQDRMGLRGGDGQEQDWQLHKRTLWHVLGGSPAPHSPPRNPAGRNRRTPVTAHFRDDSDQRLDESPTPPLPPRNPARENRRTPLIAHHPDQRLSEELNRVINLITRIDESRSLLEPLVIIQFANPNLDIANVPNWLVALVMRMDEVLVMRQELWRQAKVLAWPDDEAMQVVRRYATTTTTLVNVARTYRRRPHTAETYKIRPHTTEANLRGGGSDQSMTDDVDETEGAIPRSAAPPVPARNPARIHVAATSSDRSELNREIAALERDLLWASQQFLARVSQVRPPADLADPEADRIERLAVRLRELHSRRTRTVPSHSSPSKHGNSSTGTDVETQAARSALTPFLHAADTRAPRDRNINTPAPESRSPEPQVSSHPAPAHPPYRIINCQDWTWPHPNWQFDNLSPSQKISLLRERSSWLARQRDIQEERRAIDVEIARLRSILSLERCPETYRNPVTRGYDRLGNPINGYLARRYNRVLDQAEMAVNARRRGRDALRPLR